MKKKFDSMYHKFSIAKIILALLFVMGTCQFAQAQFNFDIQKGPIFNDEGNTRLLGTFADGHGGMLTLTCDYPYREGNNYHVRHFDNNLKLVSEKKFTMGNNRFRGLMISKGKIYIFDFNYNKSNKKYNFDVLTSPLSTFQFERHTLFSTRNREKIKRYFPLNHDPKDMQRLENAEGMFFQNIVFSPNKKYFVFIESNRTNRKAVVYNSNLEKIFERKIKTEYGSSMAFNFWSIRVGNDGSIYVLGNYYKKGHYTEACKKCHFALIKLTEDDQKTLNFNYENHQINYLILLNNGKRLLSCVGLYSEKNGNSYQGVARFNLNPKDLTISNKFFLPFSKSFLRETYGKAEYLGPGYAKPDAYLFDNGDIVFNMEDRNAKLYKQHDGSIAIKGSYFMDIVSFKVSADGKLLWEKHIDKNQAANPDQIFPLSYGSIYKNGKVCFFINYRKKKSTQNDGETIYFHTGTDEMDLFAVLVGENGGISYKNILPHENSDMSFYVKYAEAVDDNGIILIGRDGLKKRLIRISH